MKQSIGIQIPPSLKAHYDVHIGNNLLPDLPELLPAHAASRALAIITDETVNTLYGKKLIDIFEKHGKEVTLFSFSGGELQKNEKTKSHLESALLKKRFGRDTCIIALGGGVVGDVAGFVASTYMRGVPYIQIPTTLLAMLDSSIGGKTAINTPEGKNLIGAFWHPSLVVADLDCLDTLPAEHITNGWIEALKIFMTCDAKIFKEACQDGKPTLHTIRRAIELKGDIVTRDPHEKNERAVLNFGHTIGHALEKATDYKLLHGHTVGYGILVESQISFERNLITRNDLDVIMQALAPFGIIGKNLASYDIKKILQCTRSDKKAKDQEIHYVLLNGIGKTVLQDGHHTHAVTDDEVKHAWQSATQGDLHGWK